MVKLACFAKSCGFLNPCRHMAATAVNGLMVKILIMTIQVNFVKWHKNSLELSLLKFLPLTYHHSHFLAATLDFTSFFTIAFLRAAHFFYSLAVLD